MAVAKVVKEATDDTSTATVDGDNVVSVEDYSNIIAMEENPMGIFHSDTKENANKAFPDKHFVWVKNGSDGRMGQINLRKNQGYKIVVDPQVVAPAQLEADRKKSREIRVNELTLMECPIGQHKARMEYFKRKTDRATGEVKKEFDRVDGSYTSEMSEAAPG